MSERSKYMSEQPLARGIEPIDVNPKDLTQRKDPFATLVRNVKRLGGFARALPAFFAMGNPVTSDLDRNLNQEYGTQPHAEVTTVYPPFSGGSADSPLVFDRENVNLPTTEQQTHNETDQCVIPEYSSSARVRVVNEGVNLRAEPNTSSEIYEFLEAGTRVIAEPENELWSRVTYIINADGTCVEVLGGFVANTPYTTEVGLPVDFVVSPDLATPPPTGGEDLDDDEHLVESAPIIVSTSVAMFNEQIADHITEHPELNAMFTPLPLSEQDYFTVNGERDEHGIAQELVRTISGVESLPIYGTYRGFFEITLQISGVSINQMILVQEIILHDPTTDTTRSQFFLYGIATGTSDAYSPIFRVPGNDLANVNTEGPIPNLITHDEVNSYLRSLEEGVQLVVELVAATGEPLERYEIGRDRFSRGLPVTQLDIQSDSWAFTPFGYYAGDGQQVAEAG